MIAYYADGRKYLLRTRNPLTKFRDDKEADQTVQITGSTFGIEIWPNKRWTPLCEKLFKQMRANGIRLESMSAAPEGCLGFVNDLKECTRLAIESGTNIELSPLSGNIQLKDLQLGSGTKARHFDLSTLPNLQRCWIPLSSQLASIFSCRQLISLGIAGGQHVGILRLNELTSLEELICSGVSKLRSIEISPKVRLRSLELSHLKEFELIQPLACITEELRVVELNRVPSMCIEWLQHAPKVECIALRVGEIPSIHFLSGLKRLQVLDLFGTKVKDGDLSFRDSLKGRLDPRLWGGEEPTSAGIYGGAMC